MDPTIKLLEIQNSFGKTEKNSISSDDYPEAYSIPANTDISPLQEEIKVEATLNLEAKYCDTELFANFKDIKASYSDPKYEAIRRQANPFENLGKSIFMNRAAMKIIGIDALYNVSRYVGTFLQPKQGGKMTFCDIAGGPGSFTQYIQWRHPYSFGYGITLKEKGRGVDKLDWDRRRLDMNRFVPYYGSGAGGGSGGGGSGGFSGGSGGSGNGDLYKYWRDFIKYVREREYDGVDLAVADGGFEVEDKYTRQEFATSHLILVEILTAVSVLKVGSDFVCKMYDSVTEITAQLLYLCALCFESVSIIKPIGSRLANAEKYFVCKNLRKGIEPIVRLLEKAATSYYQSSGEMKAEVEGSDDVKEYMVTQLFPSASLPKDFVDWLTRINNIIIDSQLTAAGYILRMITEEEKVEIPQYYLYKAFTLWNIPDNGYYKKPYQISLEPKHTD